MVSEPVLFDTNILIDFMNGIPQAEHEIDIHSDRAISVINRIEVLAGTTLEDAEKTNDLLQALQQYQSRPRLPQRQSG